MKRSTLLEYIESPCDLIACDEVDSTNDVVRRLLAQSETAPPEARSSDKPLVVIADRQTAGRGRLGRTWASPPGGAYISLSFALDVTGEHLSALPLVVACAVRRALCLSEDDGASEDAGTSDGEGTCSSLIQIKWPNDIVLVQGTHVSKLAGILIETVGASRKSLSAQQADTITETLVAGRNLQSAPSSQVIIGVGVNIIRPAQGADERACYLSDLVPGNLDSELCAARVINAICAYVKAWEAESFSFAAFCEEYERYLALVGKTVMVSQADGSVLAKGAVRGVNDRGQLLVQSAGSREEIQAVFAGEVTLRSS